MKKVLFIALIIASYSVTVAQDVKIKKGVVFIDGKETVKFVSLGLTKAILQTPAGMELLTYEWKHSPSYSSGYHIIGFVNPKISYSTDYGYTYKLLIEQLLSDGVLVDGKFNSERVKQFAEKHDRHIVK